MTLSTICRRVRAHRPNLTSVQHVIGKEASTWAIPAPIRPPPITTTWPIVLPTNQKHLMERRSTSLMTAFKAGEVARPLLAILLTKAITVLKSLQLKLSSRMYDIESDPRIQQRIFLQTSPTSLHCLCLLDCKSVHFPPWIHLRV